MWFSSNLVTKSLVEVPFSVHGLIFIESVRGPLRPIDVPMIKNGPSMYLNDKKWPIDVPIKTGTPIHVPHFWKKKGPIDVPGSLILRPMFAAHPYNHFCTEYPPPGENSRLNLTFVSICYVLTGDFLIYLCFFFHFPFLTSNKQNSYGPVFKIFITCDIEVQLFNFLILFSIFKKIFCSFFEIFIKCLLVCFLSRMIQNAWTQI